MNWIIMPVVNNWLWTKQAIKDCLAQSIETRILVVYNGADPSFRIQLEGWAEEEPRLLCWFHSPALPSLAATWNTALDFVWEAGGAAALVVNNDVRLHRQTYERLLSGMAATKALFITAVGVTQDQFEIFGKEYPEILHNEPGIPERGGPDFSCFLISKACHRAGRFDEGFVPAYCEDLDYHRRLMLGGHADKIFSINLPFLHYASGTIKEYTAEEKQAFEQRIGQSRRHYEVKWGGPVNQERFRSPFGENDPAFNKVTGYPSGTPVTTPELQAYFRRLDAQPSEAD